MRTRPVQARAPHAGASDLDRAGVGVVALDGRQRGPSPASRRRSASASTRCPGRLVVPEPALEAPARARESRRDVAGHERGLDEQRARAAQGVDERAARLGDPRPASQQQHRGRERLLHRRLDLHAGLAVAASVQRAAGEIDRDRRLLGANDHVDAHVGVGGVHARPTAEARDESVGDGVFDPDGGELRVAQLGVDAAGVDGERSVRPARAPPTAARAPPSRARRRSSAGTRASVSSTREATRDHRSARYALSQAGLRRRRRRRAAGRDRNAALAARRRRADSVPRGHGA